MAHVDFVYLISRVTGDDRGCTEPVIDEKLFYFASIGPAVFIYLLLSFNKKRRNLFFDIFYGRPGVLHPMDLTTKSKRIYYACAFGSTTYLVVNIMLNNNYSMVKEYSHFTAGLTKLLSSLVFGLMYLPVFTCMTVDNAVGYLFGSLYTWMLMIMACVRFFNCPLNEMGHLILFLWMAPYMACSLYLSAYNTYRFVEAVMDGDWLTKMSVKKRVSLTVENIGDSSDGRHVKQLLTKPPPVLSLKFTVCQKIVRFIKEHTYTFDAAFTYSARLLATTLTGLIIMYQLFLTAILIVVWQFLQSDSGIIGIPLLAALGCSFIASFYCVIRHMKSYRQDMYRAYRGDFRKETMDMASPNVLVGAMKYSGYQVIHIALSFITNAIACCILGLIVVGFIIILTNQENETIKFLLMCLEYISPIFFWYLFNSLSQYLSARFVFLQNPTQSLAITNRRVFFLFAYFTFFANIIQGFAVFFFRMLQCLFFTFLLINRLDKSCLPQKYMHFDTGYKSYLGFIRLECSQNHPVMRVFINLLNSRMEEKREEQSEIQGLQGVNGEGMTLRQGRCPGRAVFRWQLLYTLINNPSIRLERRGYAKAIMEAAKYGITFPKSDLLIDPNAFIELKAHLEASGLRSISSCSDISDNGPLTRLTSRVQASARGGSSRLRLNENVYEGFTSPANAPGSGMSGYSRDSQRNAVV